MKLTTSLRGLLAASLSLSATIQITNAGPVTIPDFSFEITAITPGGATGGGNVGTNWLSAGSVNIQDITNTLFAPTGSGDLPATADGTNYAVVNGGNPAELWQDIGALRTNTTYTLTIAVGESLAGTTGAGFIALVNSGSNAASAAPFFPILASSAVTTANFTPGTFVDSSVVFTTGYETSGDLTILMETTNGSGTQLLFDNVRLNATPVTATTALLPIILAPSTNGSATVYSGAPVTLGEVPAGNAPFTFQWLSDNGTHGATFTAVANATNGMYQLSSTASLPNGAVQEYEVVVNGSVTSPPVTLSFVVGPPMVTQDTLPNGSASSGTSSDVVGSQVTFSASFAGNAPLHYQWMVDYGSGPQVPTGAEVSTNTTLTITNLQVSDSGSYFLVATDPSGSTNSSEAAFVVATAPSPDANGIVASAANQYGRGNSTQFTPTWVLATNSLLSGVLPFSSVGNFQEAQCGGLPVLTDGQYGILYPPGNASPYLATAGNPGDTPLTGPGSYITYNLPPSTNGWDITNITIYGGWSDGGRDQQCYTISYSTIAAPTNFGGSLLANAVNYLPSPNDLFSPAVQSATRLTLTSGSGGAMIHNIAGLQFFFGIQNPGFNENAWEGYAEIDVQGTPSKPAPVWITNMTPATIVDVAGDPEVMYVQAASTAAVSYQWQLNTGGGPVPVTGATNSMLNLANLDFTNAGSYTVVATAGSTSITSLVCSVTVNPPNGPDGNNVIEAPAYQNASTTYLYPTWNLPHGSLIAGTIPSVVVPNANAFNYASISGGLPALTDGTCGFIGAGNDISMATCGNNQGQSLIYTLSGSESGFDITNISVYGGWNDAGRDEQAYTISYSTVTNPTVFTVLTAYDFLPSPNPPLPNFERIIYTSGTPGTPLATHVGNLKFDFTTPNGGGENGWEGYAEIDVYGNNSTAVPVPPYVTQQTLPTSGFDVVGSSVVFTTGFNSSQPMTFQWQVSGTNIPGATTTTLTLTNLQLTNTGSYGCIASNSLGVISNTPSSFTVNPASAPVGGVIASEAGQTWSGSLFTPTWTVAPGSIIAGTLPSATTGPANGFTTGSASVGGLPVLTDGLIGPVGGGTLLCFAAAGSATGGATATYTLKPAGYNLSSIVVYGGWQDDGRDEQCYTISYSTVAAPSTFIPLETYGPTAALTGNDPNSTRVTLTESGGGYLAKNVAAVMFNFASPAGQENSWQGYSEIDLYGATSGPTISTPIVSGGNLILTGTGGTAGGTYHWLTTTNLALPLSAWATNSAGVFNSSGAFSNVIPISPSQPAGFVVLKIP